MAEKKNPTSFTGGATPTVTTKKTAPPGKKKVIRRLVKNAKTGEVIKTEIVRIDSNGDTTVTSYPAGTPVPSLGSLQAASSKKSRNEANSPGSKESLCSPDTKAKAKTLRGDIGPSVPTSMPGLEDLLEKEKELLKAKNRTTSDEKEERKSRQKKPGDENLETALISIMKRKRQRDPKSRKRGLMASTMSRRADSDEDLNEGDTGAYAGDTDYRLMPAVDEEEENKKRKERHRRRREKKHRDKPAAYREGEPPDSGIDAQNDQRPYDPEDEEHELHPLEEAELLAKQLQASATLKQNEQLVEPQPMDQVPADAPSPVEEKTQMSDISDDDLDKPKKKKKKHKNKKKKKKKQKRRGSDNEDDYQSDRSLRDRQSSSERDKKVVGLKKEEIDAIQKRSRSRSNSFSSLTLSSISSEFSDSFDFAEAVMMPMGDFDRSVFRGGMRGRGGFVPFRGRAAFRGYPRGRPPRGAFRGGRGGFPGGMFPEGMDVMGGPMFMGRGVPGMWRGGPWGPMIGGGRGGAPFNNFDDGGIGIYVEDESEGSRRSRSYSSYSSYSSRSHSRSRRRHRRRRHSSSRSYSSYSRSSRSYSRSYSRSSRSYSRSYSSYSSDSRSRSRSRSKKSGAAGWSSSDSRSRRPSPNLREIYSQGANVHDLKQEEEVPWWAEFDKTYEIQKKEEKEAKLKAKAEEAKTKTDSTADKVDESETAKPPVPSYDFSDMTSDDIDVVRCLMSVVDEACRQQDPVVEDTRRCLSHLLDEVSDSPELQSPEAAAKDCIDSLLDEVCPDDPVTIQRSESDKTLQLPPGSDDGQNKLLRCYTIARHVTDQTRAMRRQAKLLASEQNKSDGKESDSDQDGDRRRDDRKGRHGRRRRRSRSRRRRRRSYSRSSYSSSGSEKRSTLVNLTAEQEQSLQQAQQMLILQQQQLQAAGILPKSLTLPTLPTNIPSLIPNVAATVAEPEVLSNRWDKDMDALLKTKSKDDLTRKLMQRMKEKKQLGETGDMSPTFLARSKGMDGLPAEKIFSGAGNLKSRKIAISSIDKSKVFEEVSGYKKSDIAAAQASMEMESRDSERTRALEQRGKLEAWSDEQKVLKEEVKRKMREEIEKAERAKKELIKEQMLEAEKQKEIMRIREEVREQIKKEIRDEIEKQRKQVLEDPELKSQLMELEALRQSKIPKSDASTKSYTKPLEESFVMQQDKHKEEMDSWLEQNGKRASDMNVDEMRKMQMVYMQQLQHWSQQQQKTYMQWYWHQQQHFQQHNQTFNQSSGFYNRTSEQQRSHAGEYRPPNAQGPGSVSNNDNQPGINPGPDGRGSTFTHAPSKGPDKEGTTHSMPPRGVMSSHAEDRRHLSNPNRPPFFPPHSQFNDRRNMPGNFPPQNDDRGPPNQNMFQHPRGPNPQRHPRPNHPRFTHQNMLRPDMPDYSRNHLEPNQAPLHQYPPSDFDGPKPDDKGGNPPVSGMHGPSMNRFGQQKYDEHGHPLIEHGHMPYGNRGRPPLDQHGQPLVGQQGRPLMDQHGRPPLDQHGRPPLDQHGRPIMDQHGRPRLDQHGRPLLDQHGRQLMDQHGRPSMDQHNRPMLDQSGRPLLDQHGHPVVDQHNRPSMDQPRSTDQQGRPLLNQAGHSMNQHGRPLLDQHGRPVLDQHGRPIMDQQNQLPSHNLMSHPEQQSMNQLKPAQATLSANNEQPPPPGVDTSVAVAVSSVVAPPGVDDLAPPGEEQHLITAPPGVIKEPEEAKTPTPTKSSKKKKKKHHRKHKKKRDQSSSSDEDGAQRSAIMEQLKALQAVEDGELAEVEDGEVQSDDDAKPNAIATATALLRQLEAKKKKKHKKRKRRRRDTSSEEEEEEDNQPVQPDQTVNETSLPLGIPPPPFFQEAMGPDSLSHPSAPPGSLPPNYSRPNEKPNLLGPGDSNAPHPNMFPGMHQGHQPGDSNIRQIPLENQHQHPLQHREFVNSPYAPHIQQPPERYSIQPNPQGAGEPHQAPQEMVDRNDRFTHFIGPGGDHTLGQNQHQERKRSPSPLPLVIPSDPHEMEMWARRMEQRYTDDKPREDVKSQNFGPRKVEKIPSVMDKHPPQLEPRHIASLGSSVRGSRRGEFVPGGRQHPDDDRMPNFGGRRKRERGMVRGRGRKRRRGMPRNYHDWDQPADDGMIYYYSGSENSSGWGSDKDFDDMLAKKKRESIPASNQENHGNPFPTNAQPIHVTNTRRPSPVRRDPYSSWDRLDHMGEPQGIPVIGSSKPQPQPIPSLANRGGPPLRNEYDHLGRPLPREDEFKIHQDYSAPNDQQMMLRSAPQWDHPVPLNRDPPHLRPGDHMMRGRIDPLRRPF